MHSSRLLVCSRLAYLGWTPRTFPILHQTCILSFENTTAQFRQGCCWNAAVRCSVVSARNACVCCRWGRVFCRSKACKLSTLCDIICAFVLPQQVRIGCACWDWCVCEFVCVWCVFILAFRAYHVRKLHLNTTSGFRNTTSGFLRVSMRNVAVD
jgi:hypothetical protein